MNPMDERDLMRLLHGELSAADARELEARLAREPELAAARRRLERSWGGLALPAAAAPPGFAGRVMARVREEAAGPLSWSLAPRWVRATAAAALAAGIALGAGLAGWQGGATAGGDDGLAALETTLAESYADAVGDLGGPEGLDLEADAAGEALP